MYKRMHLKEDINFEKKININEDSHLNSLLKRILLKRGFRSMKEIEYFLNPELENLYDPFLMNDMKKAVNRINQALNQGEKIIVYGDYDVDGITSSTLLYLFFKNCLDTKIITYLPDRHKEGYGLNKEAVENFIEDGYQLLITVDCGITDIVEVDFAVNNGLDVIVTDHHQPGEILPAAEAVINPHRRDDNYPFKQLAGVGVAFKLCQALEKDINKKDNLSDELKSLLEIVALGTVADIVPLKGENRILLKNGLEMINKSALTGLKALIDRTGLDDKIINPGHIGYILAPNLNAAGRLDNPEKGIELLSLDSKEKTVAIAEKLIKLNKKRQAIEQEIYDSAVEMVEAEVDLEDEKAVVLASEDWHQGVIGIVASRLVERYYRPVILIALEGETGKGSCRSIEALNLFQSLEHCKDILENYGGHAMAAGLTVKKENVDILRKTFNEYLERKLNAEDLVPGMRLDAVLKENDIDMGLYQKLEVLKPFGVGNPRPRFLLNNINLKNVYTVGRDNSHLKFSLQNGVQGIGFNQGHLCDEIKSKKVDLGFSLRLNHWQGREQLQLAMESCNIRDDYCSFPVVFETSYIKVYDKRGIKNKLPYIYNLAAGNRNLGIFINSALKIDSFEKKLEEKYDLKKQKIVFFSGMSSLKEKYKNEKAGSKLDDLLLISLPFSIQEIKKMIAFFDSKKMTVHLLYGDYEKEMNKKLINEKIPMDEELRNIYCCLQSVNSKEITVSTFKEFAAEKGCSYHQDLIKRSLVIFDELDLIKYNENNIIIKPVPANKLDLSNSVSYNKCTAIIDNFNKLCQLAFAENIFSFLDELLS